MTEGNFRTRRSALHFGSGLVYTAVTILIAFVATPLLLRWLGAERFGAWRAASDWLGHLSLLELGLAGTLAPLLALARGAGNVTDVRLTMVQGVRSYVRVAILAIAAGLLLAAFINRLVPVDASISRDLTRGCLLAVTGLILYPFAPFRSLADADQRGYVVNLALLAQSLVITGLSLVLAWRGWGITGQFAALVAGQVLFVIIMTVTALRRHPGLGRAITRERPTAETRERIRRLNLPTFFYDLAGRAATLTDNIVIAVILGPSRVVPLFLTQRLALLAQGQLQSIGTASWAALGELHAMGRAEVFRARLTELTRLVAAMSIIVLVPIAAHTPAFVRLWVGDAFFAGGLVVALAAYNGFVVSAVSLWGWCFSGTGKVATLVPVMLASAAINVAVSIGLTYVLGLAGPLAGTAVAITVTTLWYLPKQLHAVFGVSPAGLAQALLRPVLWLSVPAALICVAAARYPAGSWITLLVRMSFSGLVLLAAWWLLELRPADRAHYLDRLRIAIPALRRKS